MNYPGIIKLPNRYKENVYLNYINNNRYELITPDPYYRVGIKDDNINSYSFVDPSGGPFINENSTFVSYPDGKEYIALKIYSEQINEKVYRTVIEIEIK